MSRNLVLLLIAIRLNDIILVQYSRFIIAVASVYALTSINREKNCNIKVNTCHAPLHFEIFSTKLNYEWRCTQPLLGWVTYQWTMEWFFIKVPRFFISNEKYGLESSLKIIFPVVFVNSRKSVNFTLLLDSQNNHYDARFAIYMFWNCS